MLKRSGLFVSLPWWLGLLTFSSLEFLSFRKDLTKTSWTRDIEENKRRKYQAISRFPTKSPCPVWLGSSHLIVIIVNSKCLLLEHCNIEAPIHPRGRWQGLLLNLFCNCSLSDCSKLFQLQTPACYSLDHSLSAPPAFPCWALSPFVLDLL